MEVWKIVSHSILEISHSIPFCHLPYSIPKFPFHSIPFSIPYHVRTQGLKSLRQKLTNLCRQLQQLRGRHNKILSLRYNHFFEILVVKTKSFFINNFDLASGLSLNLHNAFTQLLILKL